MQKNKADYAGHEPHEPGDEYRKNYITGLWKFSDKITIEQLIEVAKKWAEDSKYLQLYIRKCSKDQYGIGVMYDYTHQEPTQGQNADYMNPVSDALKRQFGNDLVGWDFGSPTWIIK